MNNVKQHRNFGFWLAAMTLLGAIAIHSYLTSLHYKIKLGSLEKGSFCNISSTFNCDAALSSSYAELFDIPMAIWGLAFNLVLLIGLILVRFDVVTKGASDRYKALLRVGAGLLLLASVVMASLSTFMLKFWCPMCMAAYFLSVLSAIGIWIFVKDHKLTSPFSEILKTALLSSLLVFVITFFVKQGLDQNYNLNEINQMVQMQVEDWSQALEQSGETVSPLVMGPERDQAVMVITEFADFLCGHCKHAAPQIKSFLQSHPDVRIEFQVFALDGTCNPAISQKTGVSCKVASSVLCSAQQQKGWEAHGWVFENQEKFYDQTQTQSLIEKMGTELALNKTDFETCLSSAETATALTMQAELGKLWTVEGTPAIYVNRKKIFNGQNPVVLDQLYRRLKK